MKYGQELRRRRFGFGLTLAVLLLGADSPAVPATVHRGGGLGSSTAVCVSGRPLIFEPTQLEVGRPLTQRIGKSEKKLFSVDLQAGHYGEILAEWQGIDLVVTLLSPSEQKILDVAVIQPGPITIGLEAVTVGKYLLQVTTPVAQNVSGSFQLTLRRIEMPKFSDRAHLAAQKAVSEGRQQTSPQEAISKYNEALSQWTIAGDTNGAAQTLLLIGDAYRTLRDFSNARTSYESAGKLWAGTGNFRGVGYTKMRLGAVIRSFGSAKDALALYVEARRLLQRAGDRRGESSALYAQAVAHMSIGQTPEAIPLLHSAVDIRRSVGDRIGEANALNVMADSYRVLGELEKSLALYDQLSETLKDLDYRLLEAVAINGRVLVYDDSGDWERARAGYVAALSDYESLLGGPLTSVCTGTVSAQNTDGCGSAATVIDNLGETHNSLGQPERALQEFSKSLLIRDALSQPFGQGSTRSRIGYSYYLSGDFEKARQYYQQALEFQEKAGDDKGRALTLTYLGMLHVALNEPKRALELYQKAKPLQKSSGDKRALAITLDKLGHAYTLAGNLAEARIDYDDALVLWRAIKDPDGEALTLLGLANCEREAGNLLLASQHIKKSLSLVELLRTRVTSEKLRVSYLASKSNHYELDIDLKMQLAKLNDSDEYVRLAFESNEKSRGRALLDALKDRLVGISQLDVAKSPSIDQLVKQRTNLIVRLGAKARARTSLLSASDKPDGLAFLDNEIDQLSDQLDDLETKIRKQSPRVAALTESKPASIEQVHQNLDNETLLLEFSLGEKRSYVWGVTNETIHGFELAPRDKIESLATRLLHAITARNRVEANETPRQRTARVANADKEYAEAAAALSKLILEPVASMLGQKRLVVVADGALQLVPFALLPEPASAAAVPSTVIAQREIVSLPSASVLALQRRELANRKPAPFGVAVLADPVFDRDDSRVAEAISKSTKQRKNSPPSTPTSKNQNSSVALALRSVGLDPNNALRRLQKSRFEATQIVQLDPNSSLKALDFDANRATATSSELSNYRYIHFATHGVVDLERPELSGIVFSMVDKKGKEQDGYLRLYEIYNLNLPVELVVLSACQTGVGKQVRGEGLIALTRGFMHAGAARVVASLWKVDDSATAELMKEFYKEMLTNPKRPAAALRDAQITISKNKQWQSPYYWAGFVLQGEWR